MIVEWKVVAAADLPFTSTNWESKRAKVIINFVSYKFLTITPTFTRFSKLKISPEIQLICVCVCVVQWFYIMTTVKIQSEIYLKNKKKCISDKLCEFILLTLNFVTKLPQSLFSSFYLVCKIHDYNMLYRVYTNYTIVTNWDKSSLN